MLAVIIHEGQLILDDDCLRVETSYDPHSNLIIWQPDYFPSLSGDQVEIVNRDGQAVAPVGELVSLGGGGIEISNDKTRQLRESIPVACAGPYFLMGSMVSQPLLTPLVETPTP